MRVRIAVAAAIGLSILALGGAIVLPHEQASTILIRDGFAGPALDTGLWHEEGVGAGQTISGGFLVVQSGTIHGGGSSVGSNEFFALGSSTLVLEVVGYASPGNDGVQWSLINGTSTLQAGFAVAAPGGPLIAFCGAAHQAPVPSKFDVYDGDHPLDLVMEISALGSAFYVNGELVACFPGCVPHDEPMKVLITAFSRGTNQTTYTDFIELRRVDDSLATNAPPSPTIAEPADGGIFPAGEAIGFSGSATDPEDGPLDPAGLTWVSGLDGVIGTGATFSRDDLSPGIHAIRLLALDSKGVEGSDEATIAISDALADARHDLDEILRFLDLPPRRRRHAENSGRTDVGREIIDRIIGRGRRNGDRDRDDDDDDDD